jgi:hypothetical protein
MQKIGFKTDQIYSADEVKVVRAEVEGGAFPLRGEVDYFRDHFSAAALLSKQDDFMLGWLNGHWKQIPRPWSQP